MENNININTGTQININLGEQKGELLENKKEFSIVDSALACVMFIVLSLLFSVFMSLTGIKVYASSLGYFVLQSVVEALFAVAAFAVVYFKKKDYVPAMGLDKKVNGSMVGWCFLVSLISLMGFGNLTNVFLEILQYFGYSSVLGSMTISSFPQYIGYLISSCLIAALCEELLFRGVIESGFKKWGIKVAVGFSALIFMLMHGNAEQTVHQFIVGVIVGYVFYKTNNIWIGILIHAFNNFIPITEAYLLSFVDTSEIVETTTTAQTIGLGTILIELIIAVLLAWVALYFLKMVLAKIFDEDKKLNKTSDANDNVTAIKVDGENTQVEISIEGKPLSELSGEPVKDKKPVIPKAAIIMFALAGAYLCGNWLLNTIYGFLI